jgi:hypothetical protein
MHCSIIARIVFGSAGKNAMAGLAKALKDRAVRFLCLHRIARIRTLRHRRAALNGPPERFV